MRIFPLPGLVDARHRVRENHRGKGRENPPKRLPRKGDHSTSYNASHNITTKVMRTPNIYSAINYNGLAFFLLANVFTGGALMIKMFCSSIINVHIFRVCKPWVQNNRDTRLQCCCHFVQLCLFFVFDRYSFA